MALGAGNHAELPAGIITKQRIFTVGSGLREKLATFSEGLDFSVLEGKHPGAWGFRQYLSFCAATSPTRRSSSEEDRRTVAVLNIDKIVIEIDIGIVIERQSDFVIMIPLFSQRAIAKQFRSINGVRTWLEAVEVPHQPWNIITSA